MRETVRTLVTMAIVGGLVLLPVALTSCKGDGQEEGSVIVVNSTADANERDGAVTLREAILLASGGLAVPDLDSREAEGVSGQPGPESADTITFDAAAFPSADGGKISLSEPLPALASGSDTIDGSGAAVIVDGGTQQFECLIVASNWNSIKGLRIQECRVGVMIRAPAQ
jgi:hypothetical protein